MPIQLNVVKTTVTPQLRRINTVANKQAGKLDLTAGKMMKVKDFGHPDPSATDKDGHMAKHTLGGMAAGAGAGAAIGSCVPVVGTAFGALVGGILGASAGAIAGLLRD